MLLSPLSKTTAIAMVVISSKAVSSESFGIILYLPGLGSYKTYASLIMTRLKSKGLKKRFGGVDWRFKITD